ncbi:MAG: HU family DNA-binding protein [Candidatus Kerfeldbacteria bacterium]
MNKALLAETIAEKTGMSKKQAEDFLESFVNTVTETLKKGEEVTITGFGAFMPKFRSARMGVDPQNPSQRIQIPSVTIPKFKAGKALKDALKQSPAQKPAPAAPSEPEPPTASPEA